MIDFSELPDDGILFEQFVRELYLREDYDIDWTGAGQDGGRDLVLIEKLEGPLSNYSRKWLISCKHNAKSGKSVSKDDLGDFASDCSAIDAEGYILVCSTHPNSHAVRRLEEVGVAKKLLTRFVDAVALEKRLMKPQTFGLVNQFFPKSAVKFGWQVYNTYSADLWAAHYKEHFFYMSSRRAMTFPDLDDCQLIIDVIESIQLPKIKRNQFQKLCLRAIYYDNKHCTYLVFVDLLTEEKLDSFLIPTKEREISSLIWDKVVEMDLNINSPDWDLKVVPCNTDSDNFHLDHKSYYEPYLPSFKDGTPRRWI